MSHDTPDEPSPQVWLNQISTHWATLRNAEQFFLRYGPAIHNYLSALFRDPADAEEVTQEVLLRAVGHGFDRATPDRGRFRDYLKVTVRNAALTFLRRRRPVLLSDDSLAQLPATPDVGSADDAWLRDWQGCLLDRVWRALRLHEHQSPGNLAYTVLRLAVDHPEEDSPALAARVAQGSGRPLRADAFRKQLSRARRKFAELLLAEVAQTLEGPTPERVEEELADLGLLEYLREFLPPDRRGSDTATGRT